MSKDGFLSVARNVPKNFGIKLLNTTTKTVLQNCYKNCF